MQGLGREAGREGKRHRRERWDAGTPSRAEQASRRAGLAPHGPRGRGRSKDLERGHEDGNQVKGKWLAAPLLWDAPAVAAAALRRRKPELGGHAAPRGVTSARAPGSPALRRTAQGQSRPPGLRTDRPGQPLEIDTGDGDPPCVEAAAGRMAARLRVAPPERRASHGRVRGRAPFRGQRRPLPDSAPLAFSLFPLFSYFTDHVFFPLPLA